MGSAPATASVLIEREWRNSEIAGRSQRSLLVVGGKAILVSVLLLELKLSGWHGGLCRPSASKVICNIGSRSNARRGSLLMSEVCSSQLRIQ